MLSEPLSLATTTLSVVVTVTSTGSLKEPPCSGDGCTVTSV